MWRLASGSHLQTEQSSAVRRRSSRRWTVGVARHGDYLIHPGWLFRGQVVTYGPSSTVHVTFSTVRCPFPIVHVPLPIPHYPSSNLLIDQYPCGDDEGEDGEEDGEHGC